jgi:diguanylate cyclase (GGDEF)-like protein
MIQEILNIIDNNFMKVNILNGVNRLQKVFYEKNIECFAVYENAMVVGVVTKKELIGAHPNRIIADVMSDRYVCVDCHTHIWNIKEIFDLNKNIDVIFVKNENEIIGFVTRTNLNIELGKYIDSLTGLYKREYIFYNAYNLIRIGQDATVVFIDLNGFGYIDKKYGHINGDIILKNVAKVLRENVGPDAYLCRYAGDEFAIVVPYGIEHSRILAEKLISAIDSFEFHDNIPVSIAVGIASCKLNNKKVENIWERIKKLVNVASLASTKAKQNVDNSIIIEDIDAIA